MRKLEVSFGDFGDKEKIFFHIAETELLKYIKNSGKFSKFNPNPLGKGSDGKSEMRGYPVWEIVGDVMYELKREDDDAGI